MLGATAVLAHAKRRPQKHPWAVALLGRLAFKQAAVALANKTARVVLVLMVRGGTFMPAHQPIAPAAA